MRLFLKLLRSAALGLVVVGVLIVLLPAPRSGSPILPISGFFPEGEVEFLDSDQLSAQFLYADLDAQQSAIAEERLLAGVAAEYAQFLSELDVSAQAEQQISAALMQAQRELTDYRLAQSMNVLGERQLGYKPASNYVLQSLAELLTPAQAEQLQAVQRRFAWERFAPSYRARIDSFAMSQEENFNPALREAIIEAQFANSYELDSPHALGLATPAQRIQSQLAALTRTEQDLEAVADRDGVALAKRFLANERRQLESLRLLL